MKWKHNVHQSSFVQVWQRSGRWTQAIGIMLSSTSLFSGLTVCNGQPTIYSSGRTKPWSWPLYLMFPGNSIASRNDFLSYIATLQLCHLFATLSANIFWMRSCRLQVLLWANAASQCIRWCGSGHELRTNAQQVEAPKLPAFEGVVLLIFLCAAGQIHVFVFVNVKL